jgi:hypothetical protein
LEVVVGCLLRFSQQHADLNGANINDRALWRDRDQFVRRLRLIRTPYINFVGMFTVGVELQVPVKILKLIRALKPLRRLSLLRRGFSSAFFGPNVAFILPQHHILCYCCSSAAKNGLAISSAPDVGDTIVTAVPRHTCTVQATP